MLAISLRGVCKSFGRTEVIHGIDLDIAAGELCVLVGPSGCGKSTLLRLIAGLEELSAGKLYIAGREVSRVAPAGRGVAMVFQSYALYPHMSAYQNMAFGLKLAKHGAEDVRSRVLGVARTLRIEHLLERKPRELSGGQRQRVAIGRAMVREPEVLLLDEPLSNLDADLRVQMRIELARLHRRLGGTMVHVTHDQVEAMTLADRIVLLDAGRIAQVGPPLELYHGPRDLFVAGFIGSPRMNLLPAEVLGIGRDGVTVGLTGGVSVAIPVDPAGARVDDRVTLGVRPEHLGISRQAEQRLRAEVVVVEHLGDHCLVYLQWAGAEAPLALRVAEAGRLAVGQTLALEIPPAACHLFDAAGQAFKRLAQP